MALFRLSISLPDRPGALGLLASAVGAAGGDIRGLVVLKSEDDAVMTTLLLLCQEVIPQIYSMF